MIKHFQCDEATKDSIYISDDYTVWGSSDSINRLSDHLDDLDSQIESLKASELAHRLLYERTKEQNALLESRLRLLVEALEKIMRCTNGFYICTIAKQALAAVKENQ